MTAGALPGSWSRACTAGRMTCRAGAGWRSTPGRPTCGCCSINAVGPLFPEFAAGSTVPVAVVERAAAYLQAGGSVNVENLARFLADELLMTAFGSAPPVGLPRHGIYHPDLPRERQHHRLARPSRSVAADGRHPVLPGALDERQPGLRGRAGRRAGRRGRQCPAGFHRLAPGELGRERAAAAAWPAAFDLFYRGDERLIDVLVTTMSFAMGEVRDWTHGGVGRRPLKPWTCRSAGDRERLAALAVGGVPARASARSTRP